MVHYDVNVVEDPISVSDAVSAFLGQMGAWVSYTTQLWSHFMDYYTSHVADIANTVFMLARSAFGEASELGRWWDRYDSD